MKERKNMNVTNDIKKTFNNPFTALKHKTLDIIG
jgi:hypothetical protein